MTEMNPEEMFPPVQGGMVDTARKQKAAEQAQIDALPPTEEAPVDIPAIPVRPEAPDSGTARCITLSSAYPVARILPYDPQRRTAVILAPDNDIYITQSEGLARDISGGASASQAFYLPAGIGIPIADQGQYWAAATTTATNSRVSILISRDTTG